MQIHHDKHQNAYVENLNKALAEADPKFQKLTLEELLTSLRLAPPDSFAPLSITTPAAITIIPSFG